MKNLFKDVSKAFIKTILIIVMIIIVPILIFLIYISMPTIKHVTIYIPSTRETIYVNIKSWGFPGSTQISAISKKILSLNSSHDFVGYGFTDQFYKVSHDSLIIYSSLNFSIPIHPNFKTKIIIHQLNNSEYNNFCANFKKVGFTYIPLYGIEANDNKSN